MPDGPVAVGLDARGRDLAVRGWEASSGVDLLEAATRFGEMGVAALVVTEIGRDGMLEGPDVDGLAAVLEVTTAPVVASGGVGSVDDLEALYRVGPRRGHRGQSPLRPASQRLRRRGGAGAMNVARVIPCLDVDAGRVVKGVNFVDLADAGDPVELAARYDAEGADEIVFLDITASSDKRETIVELARRTAEEVFIPFTIGGGVREVDDARRLLRAGADKVSVMTAAVENPDLVSEIATEFGAQCMVVAIDARRRDDGRPEVFTHGGRTPTGIDAVAWAEEVVRRGAGEILLTSMDRDGTKDGFDLELTRRGERRRRRARHRQRRGGHARPPGGGDPGGEGRRGAGGQHLPLRRAHHRRGEGHHGRPGHHGPSGLTGRYRQALEP